MNGVGVDSQTGSIPESEFAMFQLAFAFSGIGSFITLKLVDATLGLRVSKEQEIEGLDLALHDERAYNN